MPPKQKKVDAVSEIKEKVSRAQSIIVTDYRGLTVAEMTELRNKLRQEGAEYKISKNRLAKIALREAGMNTMDEFLKGTTGMAFGLKDPVGAAKALTAFAKDHDKLKIVGGLMDNQLLSVATIAELSKMPSREALLGRLAGSLQSPVTKLACALHQTVAKLAYAIDAVAKQKAEQQG